MFVFGGGEVFVFRRDGALVLVGGNYQERLFSSGVTLTLG